MTGGWSGVIYSKIRAWCQNESYNKASSFLYLSLNPLYTETVTGITKEQSYTVNEPLEKSLGGVTRKEKEKTDAKWEHNLPVK